MFVLLGEQLPEIFKGAVRVVEGTGHENPWWLLVYAIAINVGLAVLRFAWVWISLQVGRVIAMRRGRQAPSADFRLTLAVSLAGVRGAITLAGVLTLPLTVGDGSPFPARDLAIFLAATVIILSLVVASVGLPRLLKGLVVLPETEHVAQEDIANEAARVAAVKAIERSLHDMVADDPEADPKIYTEVAGRLMDSLEHGATGGLEQEVDAELLRRRESIERAMRLAALRASRDELFRLARARLISDEVCLAAVRRIDLQEGRVALVEGPPAKTRGPGVIEALGGQSAEPLGRSLSRRVRLLF
jgi:CPA1 family monovalent cation:H+ antiporter